jgi:hypothetical protein
MNGDRRKSMKNQLLRPNLPWKTEAPKQTGPSFQHLWRDMDPEMRRQAADAFATGAEYAGEQASVAAVLAARLHLRPQKAAKLPPEKRAAYLASIASLDEATAGTLIRAYLLSHHQAMVTQFLDELQIPHKQGAITAENVAPPTAEALRAATDHLRSSFAPADVDFYLSALVASDAATWASLVPKTEPAGN